jgi:cell division protein FtsA
MIVAIDIGSHKICTLVGEVLPGGVVRLLGMGHAPAGGIRAGEIVHVEEAAGAIANSVERAERVAGIKIDRAIVGITGPSLIGSPGQGLLPCGRRPRPVTADDVARVLEVAGTVPLGADRALLHVLPRFFQVDDGGPVASPVNMEGHRLTAHVHIVMAAASTLSNLRCCLEMAEVIPSGLVMSTLAGAEAVLSPDERDLGVFVVDLGGGVTGLAAYQDGALAHTSVLRVGGRHMTNDISVTLQTPLSEAERIKSTHGHVLPELDDEETEIEVVPFGDDERRITTRRYVSEILAARADELANLVTDELERADLLGRLPAGAVLIGGGTELAGLPRRLGARWGVPVRVGRPARLLGLADAARGPAHADAVGLLLWSARGAPDAAVAPTVTEGASLLERLIAWLRTAFVPGAGKKGW